MCYPCEAWIIPSARPTKPPGGVFHTFVMVRTTSVEVTSGGTVPVILYPTTCGRTMEIAWPNMTASASIPPTPNNKQNYQYLSCPWRVWSGERRNHYPTQGAIWGYPCLRTWLGYPLFRLATGLTRVPETWVPLPQRGPGTRVWDAGVTPPAPPQWTDTHTRKVIKHDEWKVLVLNVIALLCYRTAEWRDWLQTLHYWWSEECKHISLRISLHIFWTSPTAHNAMPFSLWISL